MKRWSFASAEDAGNKKTPGRERILGEMIAAVPWARLEALIEPYYRKSGKVGQPPPRRQRLHRAGQARQDHRCSGRGQAA